MLLGDKKIKKEEIMLLVTFVISLGQLLLIRLPLQLRLLLNHLSSFSSLLQHPPLLLQKMQSIL